MSWEDSVEIISVKNFSQNWNKEGATEGRH